MNYPIFNNAVNVKNIMPHPSALIMDDSQTYAKILLKEYSSLVDVLSKLREETLHQFYPQINVVVNKLIAWFEDKTAANTLDIYWDMRHLKQRARITILGTHKQQLYFGTPRVANETLGDIE